MRDPPLLPNAIREDTPGGGEETEARLLLCPILSHDVRLGNSVTVN